MSNERLMKVLLAPHVSEKAAIAADTNQQFVFRVLPDASKAEIKDAVEMLFDGAKVSSVQVSNVKGKQKRFGQVQGRRASWKKAYVTLAEGDIDFMGPQ